VGAKIQATGGYSQKRIRRMNGFNYQIGIQFQGLSALAQVSTNLRGLTNAVNQLNEGLTTSGTRFGGLGRSGRQATDSLSSGMGNLLQRIGGVALALQTLTKVADFEGMSNAIVFAGGADGATNLTFLNNEIHRLKLPMAAAYEGFKTLSGGMKDTGVSAKQQQEIFTSVAQAARVMGLSADQQKGAFLAISQMASKGTVSAEELRGQLGERLPGAFAMAARAMKMTSRQLGKAMEQGMIQSTDFLPKFATELSRTFGGGVAASLNSTRAQFDAFSNSLTQLSLTIGSMVMPTVLGLLNDYIIPSVEWMKRNSDVVLALGGAIAFVSVMSKTWAFWEMVSTGVLAAKNAYLLSSCGIVGTYNVFSLLAASATGAFTAATTALNVAFAANPIGIIITALGLLAGAIWYAWNHFEGFRAFLYGMWAVMKETGAIIYERMITPLMGLGKMLMGIIAFDSWMFKDGLNDLSETVDSFATSAGTRLANAFSQGWDDGLRSFRSAISKPQGALPAIASTGAGAADKNKPDGKTKKSATNISQGGVRNIVINVGKLVEHFEVRTTNIQGGAETAKDMILRELLQVINTANQVQ
jgi:tape measure domain-containing protein